jgi:hypothetical protein
MAAAIRKRRAQARRCSADSLSAVSPTGSRQSVDKDGALIHCDAHAGCQPAIQQTASLRYTGVVEDAAFHPGHALLHFQSSGALHKPAFTGFIRM